jgi:hypothetical protein
MLSSQSSSLGGSWLPFDTMLCYAIPILSSPLLSSPIFYRPLFSSLTCPMKNPTDMAGSRVTVKNREVLISLWALSRPSSAALEEERVLELDASRE